MEVQAIARNIRISPRKVRIVADLIRGKSAGSLAVDEAEFDAILSRMQAHAQGMVLHVACHIGLLHTSQILADGPNCCGHD